MLYTICYTFINAHGNIREDYNPDLRFLICGGPRLSDLGFGRVTINRNFLLPLRLHSPNAILSRCILMPAVTSTYADLRVLDNSV